MSIGFLGKHHTEETRRKLSLSLKGRKVWNKGKTYEELMGSEKANIFKENIRNTLRKIKRTEEFKNKLRKYYSTEEGQKICKERRLRQIMPTKDTYIEIAIQTRLKELNIPFITHKTVIGQPDIFIEPNICIFADGCYWHGCEQCSDKNKMSNWIKARKISDILITQKLQNSGYIVLRFWEHDIKNDIDNIINNIKIEGASLA